MIIAMTQKKVTFNIEIPDNVSDDHLKEALLFFLEISGEISMSNPLSDGELDQLNPSNLKIS